MDSFFFKNFYNRINKLIIFNDNFIKILFIDFIDLFLYVIL